MKFTTICRRYLPALLLAVSYLPLVAQDKPAKQPTAMVRMVSVKPMPQQTPFCLVTVVNEKNVPTACKIASWTLSEPVEVPSGALVYVHPTIPAEDALPGDGAIASFTIKPGIKELIGVMVRNTPPAKGSKVTSDTKKPSYRCVAINDSKLSFKGGDRIVFNLSTFNIQLLYGGKKLAIKARSTSVIQHPNARKDGDFLPVIGMFRSKTGWRKFISTRWIADKENRTIIFLYNNSDASYPVFHGVEDNRQRKVKKGAPGNNLTNRQQ